MVRLSSLCMFGDSVGKGVVLDTAINKYTFLKDCFVNLFSRATGTLVTNYSKFGCTITKGLTILNRHLDSLPKYDYTVLEFGGNDSNFDWAAISADPDAEHQPQTPLPLFKEEYHQMIDTVRAQGGRPVMLNLLPLDAQRFFNWISRGLNADNILHWLGDVDAIFRWHSSYNDAVCQVAAETDTPLIDIRSAFLEAGKYGDLFCADGMHPNAKGHKCIFERVAAYVA